MHTHASETMRDTLKKVDLVCERNSSWINTEKFESDKSYAKYVQGWLPHLYHLKEEDDRKEFLENVVNEHCSRPDRHDRTGQITVEDTQVEIWVLKRNHINTAQVSPDRG